MTARLFYEVRGVRTPIDELLMKTPLERFVDLERATREQLDGQGLVFADVRGYLERALTATSNFDLVQTERDILLYRAIAWLVLLPANPGMPFSDTADIALDDIGAIALGPGEDEPADPKADSDPPAPPRT